AREIGRSPASAAPFAGLVRSPKEPRRCGTSTGPRSRSQGRPRPPAYLGPAPQVESAKVLATVALSRASHAIALVLIGGATRRRSRQGVNAPRATLRSLDSEPGRPARLGVR